MLKQGTFRFQGGVAAKRPGSFSTNREAHLVLLKLLTAPAALNKVASQHCLVAQPPRLGKAGNNLSAGLKAGDYILESRLARSSRNIASLSSVPSMVRMAG